MRAWKRRLVYIPGFGTKSVDVTRRIGNNKVGPEVYTLSYIPEESTLRVETTVNEKRNDEIYNLNNLLIKVENSLTESQRDQQEGRIGIGFGKIPIPAINPGSKMRKVRAAQRIHGSPNIRIISLPVESPMERKVTRLRPLKDDTQYVLHLQPFTLKDFHSFRPSNFNQSEFGNTASPEMYDYFNKMANHDLMKREYQRISQDRMVNPSKYFTGQVFGREIVENPESGEEMYDTDSVIEENE